MYALLKNYKLFIFFFLYKTLKTQNLKSVDSKSVKIQFPFNFNILRLHCNILATV